MTNTPLKRERPERASVRALNPNRPDSKSMVIQMKQKINREKLINWLLLIWIAVGICLVFSVGGDR